MARPSNRHGRAIPHLVGEWAKAEDLRVEAGKPGHVNDLPLKPRIVPELVPELKKILNSLVQTKRYRLGGIQVVGSRAPLSSIQIGRNRISCFDDLKGPDHDPVDPIRSFNPAPMLNPALSRWWKGRSMKAQFGGKIGALPGAFNVAFFLGPAMAEILNQ